MSTEQEPEQDRRRRSLLWLLVFSVALVLVLASLLTWSMLGSSDGNGHSTAAGSPLTPPRLSTDPAGGPINSSTVKVHTTGRGSAATATDGDLIVSTHVSGLLSPGRIRPLVVSVRNAGTAAVHLTAVHVAVHQPTDQRCDPSWFAVSGAVPDGTSVKAGASTDVLLHIELRDESLNQDACKSQNVPLAVSVDGSTAGP